MLVIKRLFISQRSDLILRPHQEVNTMTQHVKAPERPDADSSHAGGGPCTV